MKRSLMRTLGAGLGVAALTFVWGAADTIIAQESDDRVVIAPRGRTLSVLGGSGGYLGVRIGEVDGDAAVDAGVTSRYGVYISGVIDDGPAEDAGIEEGDVILRWNGERVEGVTQLQRFVRETPVGRTVDLTVLRDGSEREVSFELGDRSDAGVFRAPRDGRFELRRRGDAPRLLRPSEGRSMVFSRRARLGASIQSLGEQLADYFGVDGGALVTEVSEDSPAEAAGLVAGDVIVAFDGEDVEGPGDVLDVLRDQDGGSVDMRIVRDGASRTLTVELEDPDDEDFRGAWRDFGNVRIYGGEGEDISIEPMTLDGWHVGPIQLDGIDLEPFQWRFDFGEDWGDGFEIHIPPIDIPGFEIPAIEMPSIELPGLHMTAPRVVVSA